MGFMKASVFYKCQNTLGEGPAWDDGKKELLWVDIEGKTLQFLKDPSQPPEIHRFDKRIGFADPAEDNNYIVGLEDGIYSYDRKNKKLKQMSADPLHDSSIRFNDGKVDPFGNLWAGTMSMEDEPEKGKLYRMSPQGDLATIISPVSISNGLAWNPHLNKMYYVDSPTRQVRSFKYDEDASSPLQSDFAFDIPENLGFPDGMCIDSDGMLWVAHWDAYCVIRWHPETGDLITKIDLPAPRVTSCTFGGKDLSTLFITTARVGLEASELDKYPLSGSLFYVDTNTSGTPLVPFKMS